jgi:uncharacterized protein (TIGR02246 family)
MQSSPEVRQQFEAAASKWMTLFNSGDASGLAALYSEDGKFLVPHIPAVVGREAIQGFITGVRESGVTEVVLTISDVEADAESAVEHGRYMLKTADGAVADEGDYLVHYKKVDGTWLIHRDAITTDAPAD